MAASIAVCSSSRVNSRGSWKDDATPRHSVDEEAGSADERDELVCEFGGCDVVPG